MKEKKNLWEKWIHKTQGNTVVNSELLEQLEIVQKVLNTDDLRMMMWWSAHVQKLCASLLSLMGE